MLQTGAVDRTTRGHQVREALDLVGEQNVLQRFLYRILQELVILSGLQHQKMRLHLGDDSLITSKGIDWMLVSSFAIAFKQQCQILTRLGH